MLVSRTLLRRAQQVLQTRMPRRMRDYFYVLEAEGWMRAGLVTNALDTAYQIRSLLKRDRLLVRFAQEFVEYGDDEAAREIVKRIDDFFTVALV